MSKEPSARQRAAQDRKAAPPAQTQRNVCPVHRRYVHRGTECRYCTAGWPAVAADEIITGSPERIAKLAEFDRPNLDTTAAVASLRERLREMGE